MPNSVRTQRKRPGRFCIWGLYIYKIIISNIIATITNLSGFLNLYGTPTLGYPTPTPPPTHKPSPHSTRKLANESQLLIALPVEPPDSGIVFKQVHYGIVTRGFILPTYFWSLYKRRSKVCKEKC